MEVDGRWIDGPLPFHPQTKPKRAFHPRLFIAEVKMSRGSTPFFVRFSRYPALSVGLVKSVWLSGGVGWCGHRGQEGYV